MLSLRNAHPDRELLEFYDRVIDREMALMAGMPLRGRVWQNVAALLVARSLQLQRVCLDMATLGYSRELTGTSRAMLSSVIALIFLVNGRSHRVRDGKALRYLTHQQKARQKLLKYLVQSRWMSAADARKQSEEGQTAEDEFLATAKAAGVEPIREGPKERYWTGYDDKALFERLNLRRWYYHFYSPWSDDLHGGATSLGEFADDLDRTRAFNIGPHARSPWFDLLATAEFGVQIVAQARRIYRQSHRDEVRELWKDVQETFSRLKR
jgi:Family of unknown function (DUF5677)